MALRYVLFAVAASFVAVSAASAGSDLDGRWTGKMKQVDASGETEYAMLLRIDGQTGQTLYPELQCGAELVQIAAVDGYTIYIETVTEGRVDPSTDLGCIDGFLIVQPYEDKLLVEWAGNYDGDTYVSSATLERGGDN